MYSRSELQLSTTSENCPMISLSAKRCFESVFFSCLWRIVKQRQQEYIHVHPKSLYFFCPTCRQKVMVRNYVRYAPTNVAMNCTVDKWLASDERLEYFKVRRDMAFPIVGHFVARTVS